jgi:hypothetical protein
MHYILSNCLNLCEWDFLSILGNLSENLVFIDSLFLMGLMFLQCFFESEGALMFKNIVLLSILE